MPKTISDYAALNYQYRADPDSAIRTIYSDWLTTQSRPNMIPKSDRERQAVVYAILSILLRERQFSKAATLLWGVEKFTTEPYLVNLLWSKLDKSTVLWVLGAGSVGKSYSVAVWHLLDWLCDPSWTAIKVLSATEAHAKTNIFAQIKDLHASALIPLPGKAMGESLRADSNEAQGFQLMTLPAGPEARGRLRGFHPKPRGDEHPQFGKSSRIRILLDEAEEISGGVFEEVNNILITEEAGGGRVKCTGMTNPKDSTSAFGQLCRPCSSGGWNDIDEDSEEWVGQNGAQILSLDGAKSENVKEQKAIFHGFLTYEGYIRFEVGSPSYYTMCRGKFPKNALNIAVIPMEVMNKAFHTLIWSGISIGLVAVDLAFEGKDKVKLAYGKYGLCKGYKDKEKEILFTQPKKCLELVQIIEVGKSDPAKKLTTSLYLGKEIQRICKDLGVKDSQLIVDKTGAGQGVDDILRHEFGPRVLGLNYSESSTEHKILAEDSIKPCDLYDRIATEMLFATKKWLDFDYFKFAPTFQNPDLVNQLTSRRYHNKGMKLKIESKQEYKSRGNDSPDDADAVMMLIHLARLRSDELQMIWAQNDDSFNPQNRVDFMAADSYIDFNSEAEIERSHPLDEYHYTNAATNDFE